MTDRETRLRNLLIEKGIFSPREKMAVRVAENKGEVHRKEDFRTRSFFIAKDDTPLYVVKFYPTAWKFSPATIVETMKQYRKLESVKVPGLVEAIESGDGMYLVEEYLRDAVSLDVLVREGSVGVNEAAGLLRRIFTEVYARGNKPSGERIKQETETFLEALKGFVRPGLFGNIMFDYVRKVIDRHLADFRSVLSTGDIIDRNLLFAHGAWHLVDFEYSHETVFGFIDAYRNILYTSWARYYTLEELYPPLNAFPTDVAAILSLAWEYHFQGNVLDEEALETTRRHLRYLFWSAVEPSALYALDRRLGEVEGLIAVRDSELVAVRSALSDQSLKSSATEQSAHHLESLVRQKNEELVSLRGHIKHQEYLAGESDRKLSDLERTIALQRDNVGQLHSQLLTQQQLLLERDRQVSRYVEELKQHEQLNAAINSELLIQQQALDKTAEENRSLLIQLRLSEERLSALHDELASTVALIPELGAGKNDFHVTFSELREVLENRQIRIVELTNWSDDLQHQARILADKANVQKTRIDEVASKLQKTEERLGEKTRLLQEKIAVNIFIKSTLSYSIGRIITWPLELLFRLCLTMYSLLDKLAGRKLWPKGSKRFLLVNALVNIRQTIVTGTYLLRIHGPTGFWNAVRQTWQAGINLGLHKDLQNSGPPRIMQSSQIAPLPRSEEIVSTGTSVSVVIPVLNAAGHLSILLPALCDQVGFDRIEIIVVDSGSTDNSAELAKDCGATVIAIPPEEFSHSRSRNLGVSKSTQPYLLMMTQDALPSSDKWLYQMYTFLRSRQLAAVSCVELPRISADLFSRVENWAHYRHILQVEGEDVVSNQPASNLPGDLRKAAQLSDVACLIDASVFRKYGFRQEYAEDLDLGIRLISDGYSIGIMSSAKVIHSHTRPPYYYLKRSYIDRIVIAKLLGEKTELSSQLHLVLSEAHSLAINLSRLSLKLLLRDGETMPVEEFISTMMAKMDSLMIDARPSTVDIDAAFFDVPTVTLLQRWSKEFPLGSAEAQSRAIHAEMRTWLIGVFDYLRLTHECIDGYILCDFELLLGKLFAATLGRALGSCYLSLGPMEKPRMELIHNELFDGKI